MDALSRVIEALRCLPGVGPKSAQRMVFHLLQHQRQRGIDLAKCLQDAMQNIKNCNSCNNYTTQEICNICQNQARENSKICVVESPADIIAIEQSLTFKGKYFVLMGKISPIDGIGPEEIGLDKLLQVINSSIEITEVIIALSPSIEGQTTIHYIHEMLISKSKVTKISQIAHGIPSGSDLNCLDSNTISSALRNREILSQI